MKNKKTMILTIVGVATLLMAVVGATFAFFASSMDNGAKNITVGTATVSNVQLTNEMIGMSDILPGYESESHNITASATITGEFAVPYTCKISQSSESLVDLEYLVVAGSGMSSTVNNTWTSVPTSATTFLTGSLSQSSLSQTSTIKFRLHETGTNQTSGQSGVNSTVTVTCTLDGGGSLYYNNNSSANGTTTAPGDSDAPSYTVVYGKSFGDHLQATQGYPLLQEENERIYSAEECLSDYNACIKAYIDNDDIIQKASLIFKVTSHEVDTYGMVAGNYELVGWEDETDDMVGISDYSGRVSNTNIDNYPNTFKNNINTLVTAFGDNNCTLYVSSDDTKLACSAVDYQTDTRLDFTLRPNGTMTSYGNLYYCDMSITDYYDPELAYIGGCD